MQKRPQDKKITDLSICSVLSKGFKSVTFLLLLIFAWYVHIYKITFRIFFFFLKNLCKDYGVTPEYICKQNEEVKKAQEEYDNYIQENLRKAAMKRLSDEEREAVLQVSVL